MRSIRLIYCPILAPWGYGSSIVRRWRDNPGAPFLPLGPLTNIAAAIDECPGAMLSAQMVILGGAKYGGNKTPNAEYNFWQDPIAANKVLNARKENLCFDCPLPQIVLLDAFSQTSVDMEDLEKLFGRR